MCFYGGTLGVLGLALWAFDMHRLRIDNRRPRSMTSNKPFTAPYHLCLDEQLLYMGRVLNSGTRCNAPPQHLCDGQGDPL